MAGCCDPQGLLEAFQKGDEALFKLHVSEFDSVIRLDRWKAKILVAVKRRCGPLGFLGGETTCAEGGEAGNGQGQVQKFVQRGERQGKVKHRCGPLGGPPTPLFGE